MIQDLRYGIRMLLRYPGFTLVAVLTLALGIGANTAIFSLINTAMLRPLPVAEPERLVKIDNTAAQQMFSTFSYPNYLDFRDRNNVLSGLIAYRYAPLSVSAGGVNERLWSYLVTGNYFEVLGVSPAAGRLISTGDDINPGGHPVAVVSHKYWQERFGGEPGVAGRKIILNGGGYTIIGVAPQGFSGTEIITAPDIWVPMAMQKEIEVGYGWLDKRETENLLLLGRLKPGIAAAEAQASLNEVALQLEREFPDVNEGKRIALSPAGRAGGMIGRSIQGFAGLLMGVVGLALLLVCANLANLLLARAADRRREIAVRLALGAGRLRIVRQMLTESLLLASIGGAFGFLIALWLADLAAAIKLPIDAPLATAIHVDWRVFIFTCLISLGTSLLFGLVPAWQATKTDLAPALKEEVSQGVYRRSWTRSGLIVLQVALSLVLLIGGGLMLRALGRAQTIDLGFDPQNAIELSFSLRLQGYEEGQGREFQKRLMERAGALPGVQDVAVADLVPVDLHLSRASIYIEGQAPQRDARAPAAITNRVSPAYFRAMGTRLAQGREFTEFDDERSTPVAIVNETFARRFFPGEDPVGKRFSMGRQDAPALQIVGVAENGKYTSLSEDPRPFVYRPLLQSYSGSTTLIARTTTDTQKILAAVRREVQQLDPNLSIARAGLLADRMEMALLPARIAASVLGGFGILALALAAIGLYGVMSYAVSRRTREIGIRMALGAQRNDILKLAIRHGIVLTTIGIAIGLLAASALTRAMKSLLFNVSATDPATFALITLLLIAVAFLACYFPARRATKVDPLAALRHE
jgi:predicted permease